MSTPLVKECLQKTCRRPPPLHKKFAKKILINLRVDLSVDEMVILKSSSRKRPYWSARRRPARHLRLAFVRFAASCRSSRRDQQSWKQIEQKRATQRRLDCSCCNDDFFCGCLFHLLRSDDLSSKLLFGACWPVLGLSELILAEVSQICIFSARLSFSKGALSSAQLAQPSYFFLKFAILSWA